MKTLEQMKQLLHGLQDQISQIDALVPADCPNWLVQERELMAEEAADLEARIQQAQSLETLVRTVVVVGLDEAPLSVSEQVAWDREMRRRELMMGVA